ncbi:MAG: hypothetical protein Q9171_006012 [Xanthocarpia ochracea]
MPGVPSGRGCDACRKQKKKCDIDNFPCSRCSRLKIDCIGHGQQRYKFKNKTLDLALPYRPAFKEALRSHQQVLVLQPTQNLSNRLSSLTSRFIHSISLDVDTRFQLPWNFGPFLVGIPCRLGRSAALDAATDTLIAAHTSFCAGNATSKQPVLAKYSRALSDLRHDLDDVVKARSAESLCAVMVLSIAQVRFLTSHPDAKPKLVQIFIFPSQEQGVTHTEGAAQIIKSRGFVTSSDDDFERGLLLCLRAPVVFDALLTDNIHFSSQEWELINVSTPEYQKLPDGRWFDCIAAIPDLLQRCKAALIMCSAPGLHLLALELETRSLLEDCKGIINPLRERLQEYDPAAKPPQLRGHLHAHFLRSLALALATVIILNCVLSGLEGTSDWVCEDSSRLSKEIIDLAERATIYRPLGSAAFIICLRIAWMGAANSSARKEIEMLIFEWDRTCMGLYENDTTLLELARMMRRFTLQDV